MKKLLLIPIAVILFYGMGQASVPYEDNDATEMQIYKSDLVGDGFEIRKTPTVDRLEDLLEAIIAEHKGKAVFVDFWATWCMPCLSAMEDIKPLKKDIDKNDVVTIYITNITSPEPQWVSRLPGIGGIHYCLEKEEWSAITAKYDIKAIPQYMVFDKEGNKTYQTVGFPGVGTLRHQLKKVW